MKMWLFPLLFTQLSISGASDCPFETRTIADVIDCSGFAQRHGKLKLINGLQLADSFGQPIQLQGSSSFGLQYYPDCVTKDSISYLVRNWGITVFRATVSLSDSGYTANPAYFDKYINDIVTWCEELGIYVIIDWHVLDPGDPNFYLTSRGAHTGTAIDFWKKMAVLYKSSSHVIYEIANEPNGVPWNVTLQYHNAVIYEIRNIDPDTVIIAGTGHYSQELDLAYQTPVKYPHNVLYAFHFYASSHGYLFPMFEQYSLLIPVFVSEFGLNDYTCTGQLNEEVTDQYMTVFAGSNTTPAISWTIWSWSDKDETCSALLPGACATRSWTSLTCTGLYMANYMKEANINGSFGCLHSTTAYPTSVPSSAPTRAPGPKQLSNAQIVTNFTKLYGSIIAGMLIVGVLLYYLQIVYYPRRPPHQSHFREEFAAKLSRHSNGKQRTSRSRYAPSRQLSNAPQPEGSPYSPEDDDEENHKKGEDEKHGSGEEEEEGDVFQESDESETIVKKGDGHLRQESQFVITNPLGRRP
jgi:hypothetical protein